MTPVWLVVRAGLRTRWRSWLVLAVLTGLAGGLVTAVAAGARRTDAAYPRWSPGAGRPMTWSAWAPGPVPASARRMPTSRSLKSAGSRR